MKIVVFCLLSLLFSETGYGFAEMVRHGYANCNSCHISPNGGGVLTDYGNVLSSEILSTWWVTEDDPEYDEKKLFRFHLGGDARAVQLYQDTPTFTSGRFIFMQADFEPAVTYKNNLTLVTTFGIEDRDLSNANNYAFISRKHYVLYKPMPKLSVRAGRFPFSFGIMTANHVEVTERGLGWDQGTNTYNLEAAWIDQNFDVFLTGIFGRPDNQDLEKGISMVSSVFFEGKHKVGVSYFYGKNPLFTRHVVGFFDIWGFRKNFFVQTELDFQVKKLKASPDSSTTGAVLYNRFNYEITQGLHIYLPFEISYLDFDDKGTRFDSFGIGFQFFPIKHLEFRLEWDLQRNLAFSDSRSDFVWLLLHAYL